MLAALWVYVRGSGRRKPQKKSFRMREDGRQTNVFGMYCLRVLDAARCLTADSYSASRAVLDAVHHSRFQWRVEDETGTPPMDLKRWCWTGS